MAEVCEYEVVSVPPDCTTYTVGQIVYGECQPCCQTTVVACGGGEVTLSPLNPCGCSTV